MRSLALGVLLAVVLLAGLAALAGSARADDALNDLLGPREIALGEALRGGATGAAGAGLNPSGLTLNRELVFEGGYGYRQSDAASLIGVSACDSTNALPGCFFYSYAGANPELGDMTLHRATHVAGSSLSRMIAPRVAIGATAKYYHFRSDMVGDTNASGTVFDAGATVRVSRTLNIGGSVQNVWSTEESARFPRTVGGGIYMHPVPSLALSFDARWRIQGDDRSARYGGGAELFLRGDGGQSGFPLRIGALHDNDLDATYVSAGVGYTSMRWGLDLAGRREVKGGDDTVLIASMRIFGPRLAAPAID